VVEPDKFRQAISMFATGVTVITTRGPDGPTGMTASAVCSLSLEPVQLLVCISNRLPTHKVLTESGRFGVNVLGESQAGLARHFATPQPDKFAGVDVREEGGVPILTAAIATFVCELGERFPGGDHTIFIGRVVKLDHMDEARPLLYYASGFGRLASAQDSLLQHWMERGAQL
jgi:flavin reductase (DIM6/NTAB) family NADH-FMN oxidoreductase RutF